MNNIQKLRFWSYKILPLVYDDSLSYYEVLAKVSKKINELVDNSNAIPEAITEEVKEQLSSGELATQIMSGLVKAIATDEGEATYTEKAKEGGEVIWLNGTLYEVVAQMDAGTNYMVGTNIEPINISDWINEVKGYLTDNNEFYHSRSAKDYDTGVYLYWKDVFYITTKDIKSDDILYSEGENQNLKEVNLAEEVTQHYTEMHEADNNLQTQIDGNDGDIEKLQNEDVNLQNQINTNHTNVNNRISTIVAQAGTDNTEIVDARTVAEKLGTHTASTLHDSIAYQINHAITVVPSQTIIPYNAPAESLLAYPTYSSLSDEIKADFPLEQECCFLTTNTNGAKWQFCVSSTGLVHPIYARFAWGKNTLQNAKWFPIAMPLNQGTFMRKGYTNYTTNLNDVEPNTMYRFANNTENAPTTNYGAVFTFNAPTSTAIMQLVILDHYNGFYFRKYTTDWSDWYPFSAEGIMQPLAGLNTASSNYTVDADTVKINSISRAEYQHAENCPDITGALLSYGTGTDVRNQIFANKKALWFRNKWGSSWNDWKQVALKSELDAAIAQLTPTYTATGNYALFKTFGIIGDSYASGEIVINGHYLDTYEQSWGQIMARQAGGTAYNFSAGGLTAQAWLTNSRGWPLVQQTEKCSVYLIALGINDHSCIASGSLSLGTSDDIGTDNASFYGYFSKIITNLQSYNSNLHAIVLLPAQNYSDINPAEQAIAEHYGIPYIALKDHQFFSSSLYTNMTGGHPTTVAYSGMATAIEELINTCLANNVAYFNTTYQTGE